MDPAGIQSIRSIDPGAKMIFTGAMEQRREQGSATGGAQRIAADFCDGSARNASNASVNGSNASGDDRHLGPRLRRKSCETTVSKPVFNLGAKASSRGHISGLYFRFLFATRAFDSGLSRQGCQEESGDRKSRFTRKEELNLGR